MRIEQVDLTAFRSFSNVSVPTNAPRVLIAGINGSGKTTVRELIKWVLTGRCQGLDGKGSGTEVLVPVSQPAGTNGVTAALQVSGLGRVVRTAKNGSGGLTVQGFTGTSQTQQIALYAKLAVFPALLDAVLDTSAFLGLHHAEAKTLVLGLLNVHITLGDEPNSPTYSLAELDSLYQQAFEDRKVAKRVLQQLGTPTKPAEDPQPSVRAVEEQLGRLRQQLEALATSVGETAGRRVLLQQRQQKLAKAVPPPCPGSVEDLVARIGNLEERLAILEADLPIAIAAPVSADPSAQPLAVLRSRAEALLAHRPTKGCVLDAGVPCKTPKTDFKQAAKLLEAEMATRQEQLTLAEAAPPVSPVTALRRELAEVTQLYTRYTEWQAMEAGRRQDLQAVETEIAALPDTSAQDTQITTLKGRIAKGDVILRQAQAQAAAVKAFEEVETKRAEQRQEVERLETLCAMLGPNGVRVQALQEAIGRFETLVNLTTSQFGWQVTFALEPWAVLVNERPVETYSHSEQFRIGIAVQLAIATLSGLNFAVIDELDMLDVRNRALVTQMVIQSPLEQVFVLGTREPGTPLPKSPGVLAYRLGTHEGRTVVLEQSGATIAA